MITLGLVILLIGAAVYFFIIRPNTANTFNNNAHARNGVVNQSSPTDTQVSEPVFSLTLPGPWKLSAQDWDARYHSYQWDSSDRKNNGKMLRVYVDTIPKDQAVNYLLPIQVQDNAMSFGVVSGNCVDFTQGAVPENQRPVNISVDKIALPSRWGLVDFLCDNGYVSHQVVGASSEEAINTVTLSGPTQGKHKFFFMYQDNNISPDLNQFQQILSGFKVK